MSQRTWNAERIKEVPFSSIRVVMAEAERLAAQGRKVYHMEIGRPDFDTPVHIKEAAIEALNAGMVHYGASAGLPELCQAIAEKLRRDNGIEVDPAGGVLVGGGVKYVVYSIMQAFLNPGDEVMLPDPCWLDYFACVRLAGGVPVAVPLRQENGFQIDPDEVAKLITPRTKILVVITPHNPTGAVASRETLRALAEVAQKRDIMVLSDEIYEKLLYDDGVHHSLASFPGMAERTITVNGFSKAYAMDGWRLGYAAGRKDLITPILKVHMSAMSCPTTFTQMGAVAAYQGPQDCVAAMVAEFDRRRRMIFEAFAEMPGLVCNRPEGGFYFFPDVRAFGLSSIDMAAYLMREAGIASVPGSAFGEYGEGFIRLAYSDSYENLAEAMVAMRAALAKLPLH